VERVGIAGAGTMGADIAAVFLSAGIPTVVRDVNPRLLEAARTRIEARFAERRQRGRLSDEEAARRLQGLTLTLGWESFAGVDLAVEAVPERMEVKQAVLRELDRHIPALSVLASNTSALSITEMARATRRPHRVAGFHFFFPATVMRLVEVVAGETTDHDTVLTLVRVAEEIHKVPVRVKDRPGFVVNRVLMRSLAEVFRFQEETGVAPEAIDRAVTEARAAPMGPFELADALGLDIVGEVAETLTRAYGDRFHPGESLLARVRAGKLGRKTGEGFYAGAPPAPDPAQVERAREVVRRQALAAFTEAAHVVDEEVAGARDVDIALRAGAGLPVGPLRWADREGLQRVLEETRALHARYGARFRPPSSLEALVEAGATGEAIGRGYHVYRRGAS